MSTPQYTAEEIAEARELLDLSEAIYTAAILVGEVMGKPEPHKMVRATVLALGSMVHTTTKPGHRKEGITVAAEMLLRLASPESPMMIGEPKTEVH